MSRRQERKARNDMGDLLHLQARLLERQVRGEHVADRLAAIGSKIERTAR
jgi:hypothetical protein